MVASVLGKTKQDGTVGRQSQPEVQRPIGKKKQSNERKSKDMQEQKRVEPCNVGENMPSFGADDYKLVPNDGRSNGNMSTNRSIRHSYETERGAPQ